MAKKGILILITFFLIAGFSSALNPPKTSELTNKIILPPVIAPVSDATKQNVFETSAAWTTFNAANGGNWKSTFDPLTGSARRVYGGAIPFIAGPANSLNGGTSSADLETAARNFITANSALFQISQSQLRFVPEADKTESKRVRYAAFDQVINGVQVVGARLVFAVNNGNMIYWNSAKIGNLTQETALITAQQALTAALLHAGFTQDQVSVILEPRLAYLPTVTANLLTHRLIYELSFRQNGGRATWFAQVDAKTATMVSFVDRNNYACETSSDNIKGKVTGGIKPAEFRDAEVVRSFPFVRVDQSGFPFTSTQNGVYDYEGEANSGLNGQFFDTFCEECLKSEEDPQEEFQPNASSDLLGVINFGTGGKDVVTPGPIPELDTADVFGNGTSTQADRTAYYHTNVARSMGKKWTDFSFYEGTVGVNVNINDQCNAFWNGSSVNFYRSGGGCNNTGLIRDVMQHEYGHGIDDFDGLPPNLTDRATGEAVGDHIALFVDHDSCIGQSFEDGRNTGPFLIDPDTGNIKTCDGVRNVDELRANRGKLDTTNVATKCSVVNTACVGPKLRECHCEGEIWGQTAYHLVQNLLRGTRYGTVQLDAQKKNVTYSGDPLPGNNPALDRDLAWTVHERLFFESRSAVASYASSRDQSEGVGAYDAYMVVDDEGDGLANGTPHAAYINDAFVDHGIEERDANGQPAVQDAANSLPLQAPAFNVQTVLDSVSGHPTAVVTWSSVPGATSYRVLRTERRDDVMLLLDEQPANGSFTFKDVGVDQGVTYRYLVQAANATSFSTGGSALKTLTISLPDFLTSFSVSDSPGGNKDNGADPGEKIRVTVPLTNQGTSTAFQVSASITTTTPGVTIDKAGPASYGTIATGATAQPSISFQLSLNNDPQICGQNIDLYLNITSSAGCSLELVQVPVGADGELCQQFKGSNARVSSAAITADNALGSCGDRDLVADPGEKVEITVNVNNTGTKNASNSIVSIVSDRTYVQFLSPTSVNLGTLAANGTQTKTAKFYFQVSSAAPFDDRITFTLTANSSGQADPNKRTLIAEVNLDKSLVSTLYDAEDGTAQGWTLGGEWSVTTPLPTSGNLSSGNFYSDYFAFQCDSLVSPTWELSNTSSLSFDIAHVTENSDAAYDGAVIEISANGGITWEIVEINEGYNAASVGTSCITTATPFFSGVSPLFATKTADLSLYSGSKVLVRVRFGSDELVDATVAGGVWIDNVRITNRIQRIPENNVCP
ncbi:PepSY domain-containing protein [bacterium]|nr:PepSY domain-containing protein [bacterium]